MLPTRKSAIRFIVSFGIISLLADMTYEGARSITGPYLAILGASGAAVGFVAGIGEFIGYGLRLVSGYISDRTRLDDHVYRIRDQPACCACPCARWQLAHGGNAYFIRAAG